MWHVVLFFVRPVAQISKTHIEWMTIKDNSDVGVVMEEPPAYVDVLQRVS